jgi:hypothetical protein
LPESWFSDDADHFDGGLHRAAANAAATFSIVGYSAKTARRGIVFGQLMYVSTRRWADDNVLCRLNLLNFIPSYDHGWSFLEGADAT